MQKSIKYWFKSEPLDSFNQLCQKESMFIGHSYFSTLTEGVVKVDQSFLKVFESIVGRLIILDYSDLNNLAPAPKEMLLNKVGEFDKILLGTSNPYTDFSIMFKSDEYNVETEIKFYIKQMADDKGAFFNPDTKKIYINPLDTAFMSLIRMAISKNNPRILDLAFAHKQADCEHEVIHFIEDYIRTNKDAKPLKMKKDYASDIKSYYTSTVEFEAILVSLIRRMITSVNVYLELNNDMIDASVYDEFVKRNLVNPPKLKLPDFLEHNIHAGFMITMKESSPKRFKQAVNKILVEMVKHRKNLIEGGKLIGG